MGIKRHTPKSLNIVCTDMEISYRKKTYPDSQSILDVKHKICCTACGRNLMKEISVLCSHPALEVILCTECLQFYGDGLFKTDKKGDDVYCRWCAQGGTIYCCSKCSVAFCKKCIDRNLKSDKKVMADINKDTWACFICVSKPLWNLRALNWAVQTYRKDILADSRKRKLSTSSAESNRSKSSKPGPASAKKSFAGPASKKVKVEETPKKPGPASKTITKKPGPASMTKPKVEVSDEDTPRATRHKKVDYTSCQIEFPVDNTPKRKSVARKAATPAKTPRKASNRRAKKPAARNKKIVPDVSSDEEIDDFEDDNDDSTEVEGEAREPVELAMQQVVNFCFKLSNNFNTKLMKYGILHKGNLTTSEKINTTFVNLHMDIKKIVHLFNAIDEKMMNQLDTFNAAQQALENEKLALEESVVGDVDCEEYGVDPKTPPEVVHHDNEDDTNKQDSEEAEGMDTNVDAVDSTDIGADESVLNGENVEEGVNNDEETQQREGGESVEEKSLPSNGENEEKANEDNVENTVETGDKSISLNGENEDTSEKVIDEEPKTIEETADEILFDTTLDLNTITEITKIDDSEIIKDVSTIDGKSEGIDNTECESKQEKNEMKAT